MAKFALLSTRCSQGLAEIQNVLPQQSSEQWKATIALPQSVFSFRHFFAGRVVQDPRNFDTTLELVSTKQNLNLHSQAAINEVGTSHFQAQASQLSHNRQDFNVLTSLFSHFAIVLSQRSEVKSLQCWTLSLQQLYAVDNGPSENLAHLRCAIPTTPSLRSFPHSEIFINETENSQTSLAQPKLHGHKTIQHHFT